MEFEFLAMSNILCNTGWIVFEGGIHLAGINYPEINYLCRLLCGLHSTFRDSYPAKDSFSIIPKCSTIRSFRQ